MRRPDVFTLDYSHPLAQGLVFGGFRNQGIIGNGSPYYDSSITRKSAVGVGAGVSYSEFLPEINRHAHVFGASLNSAVDLGAGLPNTGPFSFGIWVWTNTVDSMAMSSRTGITSGFELLTGSGGVRGAWVWRSSGSPGAGNTQSMGVDDTVAHHCVFMLVNVGGTWKIQTYLDGTLFSDQASSTSSLGQSQNPHLAKRLTTLWTGKIADPVFYNRALSPAEIALLADRTDPMLGGLIVEERPVLWFDMGGSTGTDNLTASDLVTGSPALGTPALGQVHALTATGITTSAPALGTPTLGQTHVLGYDGLVTGPPVLGSPAIAQIHALTALWLTVGAPVLGAPALGDYSFRPVFGSTLSFTAVRGSRLGLIATRAANPQFGRQ